MMGETVKQGRGHFRVTEHAGPFPEGQVRGHRDGRAFIELADEMEQQLAAGLGERQVTELVQNDQVAPAQLVGALSCGLWTLILADFEVKILSQGVSSAVSTTNNSGFDPVVLRIRCCAAVDTVREHDRWISHHGSRRVRD